MTDQAKKSPNPGHVIALVSGKGGSGKTMLAAMFARLLDKHEQRTILMDADLSTGGLSYFLGLKYVPSIAHGVSSLLRSEAPIDVGSEERIPGLAIPLSPPFTDCRFLPVGDHRSLFTEEGLIPVDPRLGEVVKELKNHAEWIVVDCRGGIDDESLAVCRGADDVILVVETDTTSFQASQHLVEVLGRHGLSRKLRGFLINKVFDDPSVIARTGSSSFRSQYLGSIPFDFDTTRDFLVGSIPSVSSAFGLHVWHALNKAYPDAIPEPRQRAWSFREFGQTSLSDVDSARGGIVIASLVLMTMLVIVFYEVQAPEYLTQVTSLALIGNLAFLALAGSIESTRRIVGRAVRTYVSLLTQRRPHE